MKWIGLLFVCFRQEGWRLEHEDIHNRESPIIVKGVVFNEMKGVYVSACSEPLYGH